MDFCVALHRPPDIRKMHHAAVIDELIDIGLGVY